MLSLAIPVQCFQTIPRRRGQISQLRGAVQLPELSACDLLDSLKAPAALAVVKALCLGTPERPDHKSFYPAQRLTSSVKRLLTPKANPF
jgi:hypothetical protein